MTGAPKKKLTDRNTKAGQPEEEVRVQFVRGCLVLCAFKLRYQFFALARGVAGQGKGKWAISLVSERANDQAEPEEPVHGALWCEWEGGTERDCQRDIFLGCGFEASPIGLLYHGFYGQFSHILHQDRSPREGSEPGPDAIGIFPRREKP